jgi:hypothetical protein
MADQSVKNKREKKERRRAAAAFFFSLITSCMQTPTHGLVQQFRDVSLRSSMVRGSQNNQMKAITFTAQIIY